MPETPEREYALKALDDWAKRMEYSDDYKMDQLDGFLAGFMAGKNWWKPPPRPLDDPTRIGSEEDRTLQIMRTAQMPYPAYPRSYHVYKASGLASLIRHSEVTKMFLTSSERVQLEYLVNLVVERARKQLDAYNEFRRLKRASAKAV